MYKKLNALLVSGIVLLALGGCSSITDPQLVTSFEWGEVEDPENVVEGIEATVVFGELFIVGQLNTPARCYNLDADFQTSSNRLTVRVEANRTNAPNCDESLGGFTYIATMSNLKFATYSLSVIHDVEGGTGGSERTR